MNEQLKCLTDVVEEIIRQSRLNHQMQQQLDSVKARLRELCASPSFELSFAFEVCQSRPSVAVDQ